MKLGSKAAIGTQISLLRSSRSPRTRMRVPAVQAFKKKNQTNRTQGALRPRRTKTWLRSGPLPHPGMHRGVGAAFRWARKMAASGAEPQILVQYLVLRKDLSQAPFSWPAGALVAQACHAATSALHIHRDHPHTAAYLQDLGRMRKVVLEAAYLRSYRE